MRVCPLQPGIQGTPGAQQAPRHKRTQSDSHTCFYVMIHAHRHQYKAKLADEAPVFVNARLSIGVFLCLS
jgi:hypothetical protein